MQTISGNNDFRCTNCPSRGCYNCPMFGVGENPEYLKVRPFIRCMAVVLMLSIGMD